MKQRINYATLLLVVIYVGYISLGIPDSLFGAAWPAIYKEFELPMYFANVITVLVSGTTFISSMSADWLVKKFGTSKVTLISTALTAIALFGYSCSRNVWMLCISSLPLGFGAGAIDSALNNFIALHYKAAQMNFLHCFYGIGVSISPLLIAQSLAANGKWNEGYKTVFWIQFAIVLIILFSLPLWKKADKEFFEIKKLDCFDKGKGKAVNPLTLLKNPKVRKMGLVFVGAYAIEWTCGIWASTYLVSTKNLPVDIAAFVSTFYWIGTTIGRFFAGLMSNKIAPQKLVRIGNAIVLVGIVLMLLPLSTTISSAALFLIGIGNAPVSPNMLHLTPRIFGKENSQALVSLEMSLANLSITIMPVIFGIIAEKVDVLLFPFYLASMFVVMKYGTTKVLKKVGMDTSN